MAQLRVEITGLDQAMKDIEKDVQAFFKAEADRLHQSLVSHTPIDRGTARRGWKTEVLSDRIESTNQVPYIERLEKNWSKQTRGKGIIGPSLQQFNRGKKSK